MRFASACFFLAIASAALLAAADRGKEVLHGLDVFVGAHGISSIFPRIGSCPIYFMVRPSDWPPQN